MPFKWVDKDDFTEKVEEEILEKEEQKGPCCDAFSTCPKPYGEVIKDNEKIRVDDTINTLKYNKEGEYFYKDHVGGGRTYYNQGKCLECGDLYLSRTDKPQRSVKELSELCQACEDKLGVN